RPVRRPVPAARPALMPLLPPELRGTPITVDPYIPHGTVRVEYELTLDGLISEVRMRIGSRATAADIAMHVPTVRAMQRYRGFSGRVRILLGQIKTYFPGAPPPPVGSGGGAVQG